MPAAESRVVAIAVLISNHVLVPCVAQVEELQRQLAASRLEAERAKVAGEQARKEAEEKANKEREVGHGRHAPLSSHTPRIPLCESVGRASMVAHAGRAKCPRRMDDGVAPVTRPSGIRQSASSVATLTPPLPPLIPQGGPLLPELQAGFEAHDYALDRGEAVAVIAQLRTLGVKRLQAPPASPRPARVACLGRPGASAGFPWRSARRGARGRIAPKRGPLCRQPACRAWSVEYIS